MKVDQKIVEILERATYTGSLLVLPEKLDRPTYQQANKVLEAAGGKWDRKKGGHNFPDDAYQALDGLFLTGTISSAKDDFEFYPTPPLLAIALMNNYLVANGPPHPGATIMEPSAGKGDLIAPWINKSLDDKWGWNFKLVDKDPRRVADLMERFRPNVIDGSLTVVEGDFLTHAVAFAPDMVVMNPPFSRQQDIAHVDRALYLMAGRTPRLLAIMSNGVTFRTNKKTEEFIQKLDALDGSVKDLPEDSFKGSGTGVNTVVVTI